MIVLRANAGLKSTFETLIKTMHANVKWNGQFVIIDNYLILLGEVRSLFFHFDSRKVVENIIDLPIKEEEIKPTEGETLVRDVINIILYAFGKWGTIKGLKVEKDYAQLNRLFQNVLTELYVEPEYTPEYFRFYQKGIRITYEDVIQIALEAREKVLETEQEETQGLWHKVVWKMAQVEFERVETTLEERKKGRLGNNFYRIGYVCPKCERLLHMVVYPQGKEFKIETPEGTVLLARACTCENCNRFYTPRPHKMLSEGDIYLMDFEEDRKAYEDYLELLGKRGDRVSSYRYNEYADKRKAAQENQAQGQKQESEENLDIICRDLADYSEKDFLTIQDKIEEGFFSDESIRRCEEAVKKDRARRIKKRKEIFRKERAEDAENVSEQNGESSFEQHKYREDIQGDTAVQQHIQQEAAECSSGTVKSAEKKNAEQETARKKYQAKIQMIERLSERQLGELKSQLAKDNTLPTEEREQYLAQVEEKQNQKKIADNTRKAQKCADKSYVIIKRVYDEIAQEKLPKESKEKILEPLRERMKQQGTAEVKDMMEHLPPNMDRAKYRVIEQKLKSYEDVDTAAYEEQLKGRREAVEQQEVVNMINRARKISRDDIADLIMRLKEQDFSNEVLRPYIEKLEDKIRKIDEDTLAKLVGDPMHMSFEEGVKAYETVENGDFLPELKQNTLEMIGKRLAKIKTDESELLVKKLKDELAEAGIEDNPKHHFYSARKVLLKQATPDETAVIDYAMASYAAGCGRFEYPILVVDTSRNESGKEGIILTPEHLYYSTMLSAYGITIPAIESVTASTGLLNKGLYIKQKNGTKTKIPYAVDNKDLPALAEVLHGFIKYLQEKPDSRNISYLAREKHENICCFRCGYVYKGNSVCPKCGYKNNNILS